MDDDLKSLGEMLCKSWPYRRVDAFVTYECLRCRCLIVDRTEHAKACFTAMDDDAIRHFATALGQEMKARG